jgi:hypothetical protein
MRLVTTNKDKIASAIYVTPKVEAQFACLMPPVIFPFVQLRVSSET